jgi:hypothetical protein
LLEEIAGSKLLLTTAEEIELNEQAQSEGIAEGVRENKKKD